MIATAGPLVPDPVRAALEAAVDVGAPVHVDLLLAGEGLVARVDVHRRPVEAVYVLLEYDRAYVFHDAGTADGPCVECFLRHAIDNHAFPGVEELRAAYEAGAFRTTFDARSLALVGPVAARCGPGEARLVLPNAGEVLVCGAFYHPSCRSGWHPTPGADGGRLVLEARPLGRGLRAGRPDVSGLVSASGPIRREALTHSRVGVVSCVTESARHRGRRDEVCGGTARTPDDASLSARCESVERLQTTYEPADSGSVEAPVAGAPAAFADAHGGPPIPAIDPRRFQFHVLREPEAERYRPSMPLRWTAAYSVTHDAPRLVPARLAWMAPRARVGAPRVSASTNGCALGGSVEEAAVHAFFELAERDGFVTSWLLRRPCRPIDPATVADDAFHLVLDRVRLVYPAYALHFLDTTTDVGVPTVWLLAVRPDGGLGPKSITTGGAALTVGRAMASALRELAGFLRKADPDREPPDPAQAEALLADPSRVVDVADHGAAFEPDASARALAFLDGAPPVSAAAVQAASAFEPADRYDARDVLRAIGDRLGALGSELLVKDLTLPPMGARGLHCVRALAPDLFPVSFGHDQQRVSVTPRLRRLAERVGVPVPGTEADLNPDVHPFA